jgi:hypothetical protein
MGKEMHQKKSAIRRSGMAPGLTLLLLLAWVNAEHLVRAFAQASAPAPVSDLNITASIEDGQMILPDAAIELRLSRELKKAEGRLAILIAQTDFTSLFTPFKQTLTYNRRILPLPAGESSLTVYLVSPAEQWQEIARFPLRVGNPQPKEQSGASQKPVDNQAVASSGDAGAAAEKAPVTTPAVVQTEAPAGSPPAAPAGGQNESAASTAQAETAPKKGGFEKLDFIPSITIGMKSQAAESHFPDATRPPRPRFADATLQSSFRSDVSRGLFNSQAQFDLAGSSFQQEALQFGRLGNQARQIDMASYLMQFQVGKAKFIAGHTSYGSNRHLINSFSSRGVTLTLPISANFDFSLAAMNGTSVVGFDNFFGLDQRKHQLLSGTLGVEFLAKRPGGARLEVSALSGYLLPINNVNQGNVNDAERSKGLGFRFIASDPKQRFRFDGGFTRSLFFSPFDPLLSQGFAVVEVPVITRNARYLEAGFDILKDVALTPNRKINLTFNFRHENVDPLFRSLAASTQADKINNQYELIATIGEINAQISHIRFNDNLNNIPSILKSLTRAERIAFGAPLVAIFGNAEKPNPFLPRLSYAIDRLHQFGAAIPINGGFEFAPEAIPDFLGTNQAFTADWQFDKFRIGYRANHSLQNNRQSGRELADITNFTNAVALQTSVSKALDVNVEFSGDNVRNKEGARTDRLLRLATGINWRVTARNAIAANLATSFAGDVARTVRNRNAEFDLQWSYQFTLGKERFKKLQGQSFVRYANRYASSRDNIFFLNNLTRAQTLNIGLSFTFF